MNMKSIIALIALALVGSSGAYAQGGAGRGYGGPPKSDAERTARQTQCQRGTCANNGQGRRMRQRDGQGNNGQGQRQRRGLRDGTGPRAGTGLCPNNI